MHGKVRRRSFRRAEAGVAVNVAFENKHESIKKMQPYERQKDTASDFYG
jgi:hypothetical protein